MIDPNTRARLRAVERMSTREGQDRYENLDRARLLLTEERAREISVAALYAAVDHLEQQPTQALVNLGGGVNTAADAHRGCIEFLRFVIKQYEER